MAQHEVDAILSRLIAQFQSPYDFAREMVQNALDAGADRIEIELVTTPVSREEVVYELSFADSGRGMDEATIDGELTRLFSSGKRGDATAAGGFGIGFVSVFAWQPEAVLLQTGRGGEAWELVFSADRTFRKFRVDEPLEGTTIRLFRRGRPHERATIAEAVRDALWRWCRFVPMEVIFRDDADGSVEEHIEEDPRRERGAITGTVEVGETRVRVELSVPAHAVFLRRGLVLAEGSPAELLPTLAPLGPALDSMRVWADSPLLRTTMQRDRVIDDDGRVVVAGRIHEAWLAAVGEAITRAAALAAQQSPWDAATRDAHGHLLAHIAAAVANVDAKAPLAGRLVDAAMTQPIVRGIEPRRAWSWAELSEILDGWPVLVDPSDGDESQGWVPPIGAQDHTPPSDGIVVLGDLGLEGRGLFELARKFGVLALPYARAVVRSSPEQAEARGAAALIHTLMTRAGAPVAGVVFARLDGGGIEVPLCGVGWSRGRPQADSSTTAHTSVLLLPSGLPATALVSRALHLNLAHLLVQGMLKTFSVDPHAAASALVLALCAMLGPGAPDAGRVATALESLR